MTKHCEIESFPGKSRIEIVLHVLEYAFGEDGNEIESDICMSRSTNYILGFVYGVGDF